MFNAKELPKDDNITKYYELIRKNKNFAVFGLNIGEKIVLSSGISNPICYVAEDAEKAKDIANAFKMIGRKVATLTSQTLDYTYHLLEFGSDTRDRQNVFYDMLKGNVDTLVVTPNILFEQFVSPKLFEQNILTLHSGDDIDIDKLVDSLVGLGYVRVSSVEQPGQFSKRGDVVDIFSLNSMVPVRVYFFDTQIEKINTFNILSQYAIESVNAVDICPNGYQLPQKGIQFLQKELDNAIRIASKTASKRSKPNEYLSNLNIIHSIKDNIVDVLSLSSTRFLSVFMETSCILDYFNNPVVIFDQPKNCFEQLSNYSKILSKNIEEGIENGTLLGAHKNVLIDFENLQTITQKFVQISYQSIMTQNKFFAPQDVINFVCNPIPKFGGNYKEPSRELSRLMLQGENILFCAKDDNDASNLFNILSKSTKLDVQIIQQISKISKNKLNIIVLPLKYGFYFNTMHLCVFGFEQTQHKSIQKRKTLKKENTFSSVLTLPKEGEYVVHDVHGIGVCEGITTLSVNNATRDYLVITYKNNDKLYVPTEQIDMLSRYVGADKTPTLNTLGGAQFEKIKQKVRASVKQLAFDLVALYKARQDLKREAYEINKGMKEEIEESFAYTLTDDQQRAIDDVYADLSSTKIMDRLVVGDVGYGKTEVAIRAAFVAALNGRQVAVLAPTTILCEQHYNSFFARLNAFGINVACINRFKSTKEQKQILSDLKAGKINVICGTHRLLSKDVQFFDLGLLILDEEQKFGVSDKEKIKNIKTNVNVLTLSATPIPRTLHLSLVGIRDISTIETPPVDRLPVQTVVSQFSNTLLTTAINRELERGGQVLVVAPKIKGLDAIKKRINELTGNSLRIEIAHGQMDKDTLESTMLKLYRGDVDVLIATSLIENGIDIPNANTLFVVNSEDFGLSQLYQLRGRVGRSDRLAWAYFTYMDETKITSVAYSRLATLLEFSQLGSGFKIAMRDLEMRGAGDIFGANQHGQMAKVGYDMYCKLLESEVVAIKGEQLKSTRPIRVDVDIDAYIPQGFCASSEERMELYSMIASISTPNEYKIVVAQIADRWGSVPPCVEGLCKVSLIKTLAQTNGVERLSITKNKIIMQIGLDYDNWASQMNGKIANQKDFRVYKKQNMAIFEKTNPLASWDKNYANLVGILYKN